MKACFVCGSRKTKPSSTNQLFDPEGKMFIVKEIPCLKCADCGETYLATETVRKIEAFLNRAAPADLEIIKFARLAA